MDSHNGWIKDIIAYNNLSTGFSYPIIADPKREVGMEANRVEKELISLARQLYMVKDNMRTVVILRSKLLICSHNLLVFNI